MQKKTIPQATIPQHVLERMESEWRQMRPIHETAPKPAAPQPAE